MKKAIVIGATSGIGKELARLLVKENYQVGITGRRTSLLEELKSEHPEFYDTQELDITSNPIPSLQKLIKKLGGLDLLILSSRTGELNPKLDFNLEKRKRAFYILPKDGLSLVDF